MAFKVAMPKLGMIESDMSIVEWKVKVGDSVEKGQIICIVEGQKITNSVEAEINGVIRGIYVPAGSPCKIGTLIAIIAGADEDISGPEAGGRRTGNHGIRRLVPGQRPEGVSRGQGSGAVEEHQAGKGGVRPGAHPPHYGFRY